MSKLAVNVRVQVFVYTLALSFLLGIYLEMELFDHRVSTSLAILDSKALTLRSLPFAYPGFLFRKGNFIFLHKMEVTYTLYIKLEYTAKEKEEKLHQ